MNLLKKDSLLYKNWEMFNKRFIDMVRWFYLVHLNYETLEVLPPVVKDVELNLLCLHKVVESLGGYFAVTIGEKWGTVPQLQSLHTTDSEAVRNCYKKYVDLVVIYHETTEVPWVEKHLEVGEASKEVDVKDSPCQKDKTVKDGAQGSSQNRFGVMLDEDDEEGHDSSHDSNDFEVIT